MPIMNQGSVTEAPRRIRYGAIASQGLQAPPPDKVWSLPAASPLRGHHLELRSEIMQRKIESKENQPATTTWGGEQPYLGRGWGCAPGDHIHHTPTEGGWKITPTHHHRRGWTTLPCPGEDGGSLGSWRPYRVRGRACQPWITHRAHGTPKMCPGRSRSAAKAPTAGLGPGLRAPCK